MPQMRLLAAVLFSLPLFSACQTPAPYVPYHCEGWFSGIGFGFGNAPARVGRCWGYSEVRLAPDTYQVRFEGGPTRALIEDFTLLRSSELTLESGFSHFIVRRAVDETVSETKTSAGTYHAPQTTCHGKGEDKHCVTTPGYWSGGGTYVSTTLGYAYTIQFLDSKHQQERSDASETLVYDALSIQRDLRQKYQLPPGAPGPHVGVRPELVGTGEK